MNRQYWENQDCKTSWCCLCKLSLIYWSPHGTMISRGKYCCLLRTLQWFNGRANITEKHATPIKRRQSAWKALYVIGKMVAVPTKNGVVHSNWLFTKMFRWLEQEKRVKKSKSRKQKTIIILIWSGWSKFICHPLPLPQWGKWWLSNYLMIFLVLVFKLIIKNYPE